MTNRPLVTSPASARIRAARSLCASLERVRTGRFLVEGPRFIHRAVHASRAIDYAVVAPGLIRASDEPLLALLRRRQVEIVQVSDAVFRTVSRAADPTGIAAVVCQDWTAAPRIPGGRWIALVGVETPGNVGTILRTCEAAGLRGAWITPGTADPHEPAAVRASMGSIFGVELVSASWRDLVAFRRHTKARLVGTAPGAERSYRSADLGGDSLVMVVGNERCGLTDRQLADCDEVVSIPMSGAADSLNVGVAAGLVLFEAFHQREQAHFDCREVVLQSAGPGHDH